MQLKMTLSKASSSITLYITPEIISPAILEWLKRLKNGQKLAKCGNLTLKYDLLTLKMTSGSIENDTIELAVLKNSDIDTGIDCISSPSRSHYIAQD